MLVEELQIGKCYYHKNRGTGMPIVREILDIGENRKVYYRVLEGSRRYRVRTYTNIKNFAKWADYEVGKLEDYNHLFGFKSQKNYTILNVAGKELLKCQENKLQSYIKKDFVKKISEEIYQFTTDIIENKLLQIHNGNLPEYLLIPKNKECVVCGRLDYLTRHHVVPKKDLKYYNLNFKTKLNNRLPICRDCHTNYETQKINIEFNEYNKESAIKWMEHFINTMSPKFLPDKWTILNLN